MKKFKLAIIGAGPIGLYLGSKVKNQIIIEQKKTIGRPTRCSGLLSDEIKKLLPKQTLEKITINKTKQVVIEGPKTKLKLKTKTNYIINNKKLEEELMKKSLENKNEIKTGWKYLKSKGNKHLIKEIKTGKTEWITSQKLIGTDGPRSQVAKQNKLKKRRYYTAYQIRIKTKTKNKNEIHFYPHIGNYSWAIPESNTITRIGTVGSKKDFEKIRKKWPGKKLEDLSGLIPIHELNNKTRNKKTILLGDSAGHIKNTTGGGIIPGMKAVNNYLNKNKLSKWRLELELGLHNLVHKILIKNTYEDWDELIKITKKHKKILEENNRDSLSKLLIKLAIEPKFWKLSIKNILKK